MHESTPRLDADAAKRSFAGRACARAALSVILSLAACGDDKAAQETTSEAGLAAGGENEAGGTKSSTRSGQPLLALEPFVEDPTVSTLLDLLSANHADVGARIGPHQLKYTAHFELKPERALTVPPKVGDPIETDLEVDDELEFAWHGVVDGHPHASLRQENSREDRRQLVLLDGQAYTRLHEDQWYQRELDGNLHETWFVEAYHAVHDVIEFAAPRLKIASQEQVQYEGRSAIVVHLERAPARDEALGRDGAPSRWRASSHLDSVTGSVVIDRKSGVWLAAQVQIGWRMTDKAQRPLIAKSTIEATLVPGKVEISAPSGAVPMPERHRYKLEREKLLDGLAAP